MDAGVASQLVDYGLDVQFLVWIWGWRSELCGKTDLTWGLVFSFLTGGDNEGVGGLWPTFPRGEDSREENA